MKTEEYKNEAIVLALGFFDGVHLGHQQLIKATIEIAEKMNYKSGVMTFSEHPLRFIFPTYTPWLITTNNTKLRMMKDMGIDHVFLNPFSEDLMKCTPEEFVSDYLLKKYNVKHIIVGFNYTFGYKGAGNIDMLRQYGERYGFELTVIPPCIINEQSVSSTLIRELISTGKVDEVPALLGRDYSITGTIVEGKGLGHKFEIPTANLKMKDKVILPNPGVYYTKVVVNGQVYDGLTNLGFNPTFEKHPYAIETYIYDFDQDIYGEAMTLAFKIKMRGEIKFDTLDALFERIRDDILEIENCYRK